MKKDRARARWHKIRDSLPAIVAFGRDTTNCSGIVNMLKDMKTITVRGYPPFHLREYPPKIIFSVDDTPSR